MRGTPIIEPDKDCYVFITFLWQHDGSARSVAVIQDWGAAQFAEQIELPPYQATFFGKEFSFP